MKKYRNSTWCRGVLKDFLDINPTTDISGYHDDDIVTFIPMTAVGEKYIQQDNESKVSGVYVSLLF